MGTHSRHDISQADPLTDRYTQTPGDFGIKIIYVDPEHRAVRATLIQTFFKHLGQIGESGIPFCFETSGSFQPAFPVWYGVIQDNPGNGLDPFESDSYFGWSR